MKKQGDRQFFKESIQFMHCIDRMELYVEQKRKSSKRLSYEYASITILTASWYSKLWGNSKTSLLKVAPLLQNHSESGNDCYVAWSASYYLYICISLSVKTFLDERTQTTSLHQAVVYKNCQLSYSLITANCHTTSVFITFILSDVAPLIVISIWTW